MTPRTGTLILTIIWGICGSPAATAGETELPAVDGINAKLSFGGAVTEPQIYGAAGSVTLPLGHRFGLQFDAAAAEVVGTAIGDVPIFGVAAHGFWRDPSRGLIGIYGSYARADVSGGFDFFALALEGAYYWERFTVEGHAGFAEDDLGSDFYETVRVAYYPTDSLRLHAGHAYSFGENRFLFGGEWAFGGTGGMAASIFADGGVDEDGEANVVAGLRFYLGQSEKSLIRRHREDDPTSFGLSALSSSMSISRIVCEDSDGLPDAALLATTNPVTPCNY